MVCLRCNSEEFKRNENATIEQEFRGETFKVKAPAMVCTKCGWQALAEGVVDELRKRTADAYRERHGLLTSGEIKALREDLDLSQQQFADALSVGVASVKRWETWLPQETSSDHLIRLKAKEMKQKAWSERTVSEWLSTSGWDVVFVHTSGIQLVELKCTPVERWDIPLPIRRRNKSVKAKRRYDPDVALAA